MRICLVYQTEFPAAAERIEKIAKTLALDGHEIFLLCNNYGDYPQSEEHIGEVHTIRVRPTFRRRALNKILKFPLFLNPLWIVQLLQVVRRFRIQAIQVIDIPLAPAAWAVGRMLGLPVVMDMWENYPEALKGWARLDWKTRVFKNPTVARVVELWITPRMDHIFTVVEEQKDRLIAEGVRAERVSVVTNAVDMELFASTPVRDDTPLDAEPETYKLLYVGRLTVERGLDDIIRALAHVRTSIPSIRLYLAGTGSYEGHLRRIVEQECVGDLVRFLGWVPFQDIQAYVVKSDLCTVPHVYNDFINTTIPNKLFQYMAMAKPVLVSHAKPLARIIRECECGFVFQSGDPAAAAAAIVQAYAARANPEIGERGKRCVEAKYTWEKASGDLVRVYRELQAPAKRRGASAAG